MRLREEAVYVRLTTFRDVLGEETIWGVVARVQEALGVRFGWAQDGGGRRRERPLAVAQGLGALEAMVGRGVNVAGQVRLLTAEGAEGAEGTGGAEGAEGERGAVALPWLEVVAGPHPYTGRYRVGLEVRVSRGWVREVGGARLAGMVEGLCELCQPAAAHAHDADDNSVQNIAAPNLLRRGFGVEPPSDPDDRPGQELNLGELRYAVNWLTMLGPEQVEALGGEAHIQATPAPQVRPLGSGRWWVQLYPDPLTAADPSHRAVQRAVAAHWRLPALARAQGPTLAYWGRRSWRGAAKH